MSAGECNAAEALRPPSASPRPRLPLSAGRAYRLHARGAAVAFVVVVLYTVVANGPSGELAQDWMHTTLHVATALAAAYAGWIAPSSTPAKAFTVGLTVAYGAIGLFGWFTDGLLMRSAFQIPLGPADNVFHLVLAVAGAVAGGIAIWSSRRDRSLSGSTTRPRR